MAVADFDASTRPVDQASSVSVTVASVIAASDAQWVAAIGTWVIGISALGFTATQLWVSGFRPKIEADLGRGKTAIRVRIRNRGRAGSVITSVSIVGDGDLVVEWVGSETAWPTPFRIGALEEAHLMIAAPNGKEFIPGKHRVMVKWAGKSKRVQPQPVDVGFEGLVSLLPPGSEIGPMTP
ncbi:hypothetical protein LRS13_09495 [Svornostia abyssi]|uniref:Uncharacterized protein n=1 Tax=Svornostia abyssi TaxID=2898438 RepID=A0ABY5PM05_9ACTN|nr:hypothetical protein LRS13_09495 [Parviterribacteraceae bacterium J379]